MNEAQISDAVATPTSDEPRRQTEGDVASQLVIPAQAQPCPTCNAARVSGQAITSPWVYAIGDVDPRYPNQAVEKEVMGAMARANTSGLSNDAALQKVLEAPENAYLVREMCWVLLVQEVETYVLVPRFPQDYPTLVEAARTELSAVIGTLGPIANPDVCNGLTVRTLFFDIIYNFDKPALFQSLPVPKSATDPAKFQTAAADIFAQVTALSGDGTGMGRALNYLAMKDPNFYAAIAKAFDQNAQLTSVDLKAVPVSTGQNLVDVIVRTVDRGTGVQSSIYARLNLDTKYPYVVTY